MAEVQLPDPQATPSRDVFISYASQDKAVADATCEALECAGVACWIAPRNVTPGDFYADAIVRALNESRVLVLLLTESALTSPHVLRELERTSAKRHPIVSIRLTTAQFPPALEYFLSASHWLDATTAGLNPVLPKLIEAVRHLVLSASDSDPSRINDPAKPVVDFMPHIPATNVGAPMRRPFFIAMTVAGLLVTYLLVDKLWLSKHSASARPAALARAATTPTGPVATAPTAPAAPRTAVAVLAFANLTGDATKDYLGDGMAEELINTLTKVQGLKVPARTSTFAYKGRNADIRQIAKDLGVGTILEGSVRAAGKRIRVTAQLINAQDGLHLWSQTYDEEFTDIFKLQDKLATAIAAALQPNLHFTANAVVTQAPPTQDLEAYQLFLQGWSLRDRVSVQNENRAIDYFEQAIARDPRFSRAYVGIGLAHLNLGSVLSQRPFEQLAAAERAASQALALDPNSAIAHAILAIIYDSRGDFLQGQAHSSAALTFGGTDAYVLSIRASHFYRSGHLRDASTESRKAMELAPASPLINAFLANAYSLSGRDAEALKYADLAVELAYPKDNEPLASIYSDAALRAGRYADATAMAIKAFDASDPEQARTAEIIKSVHAALANPGQRASAMAARARLYPAPTVAWSSAAKLTDVAPCLESSFRYTLLDAVDAAYALANQCLDRKAPGAVFVGASARHLWSPWMRPFRKDPRFQAFATRLGNMEYWRQYGPPDDCDLKDGKLTCH